MTLHRVVLTVDDGWLSWLSTHGAAMVEEGETFVIDSVEEVDPEERDDYLPEVASRLARALDL